MTRTHATLAFAALGLAAPAAHAQSLTLNSGDVVTVNGAGTIGTIGGLPVANSTNSYNNSDNQYAVGTNGTAAFTLGMGGTLTASVGTLNIGLDAEGSGPITITGGTIVGNIAGIYTQRTSSITITGGTITADNSGYGLYIGNSSGTIDLYGMFDGTNPGTTTTLGSGSGVFTGMLENNTVSQEFTYLNAGTIRLHDVALASAPEPSQFAAFAVGLLGLSALALRARKRQAA